MSLLVSSIKWSNSAAVEISTTYNLCSSSKTILLQEMFSNEYLLNSTKSQIDDAI